ncbi:MAG: insulinase family protein [Firmicutes bacterium]|nr:insulinase family protein [Bacillota bacterium]
MAIKLEYQNGLRAVIEESGAHSVSAGIWINAGSRKENAANNGISHFIEHMIFKGTDKLCAQEIAESFESRGAAVNAFTSKDCTCYYFKSLKDKAEECFSLLSHIFLDSVFPKVELDRERNVIVEELNMTEDSPEDVCFDMLADAIYDGTLARPIIGTEENILRFEKTDIDAYKDSNYCPENIVVSFAGGITAKTADRLIREYFLPRLPAAKRCDGEEKNGYKLVKSVRIDDKFEQSNLMLGFRSIEFNHKNSATQSVLNMLFGGGMSSRLFQKVREEMGLAYSVYTAPSVYVGAGAFLVCVNYSAANTGKVLTCVRGEIDKLVSGGATAGEIEKAKMQLKTAMVFNQENSQSQMLSLGKLMLLGDELYDMDKKLREVDEVSVASVNKFAQNLFAGVPALAYLGKKPDVEPEWN